MKYDDTRRNSGPPIGIAAEPVDRDPNPGNAAVIAEFRTTGGRLGGAFAGMDVLLLTTTGARTGIPRTRPVAYLPQGRGYALLGDNGGRERHPAWFHNLRANPHATIEADGTVRPVTAAVAGEAERKAILARIVQRYPEVADHVAKTDRVMPVVILTPVDPSAA